jgi:hypothetical protein
MKTILLTGTIDTKGCINTLRTDINDRINDYYYNIKNILETSDLDIVFVENSGHDLGIITEYLSNPRIEILQFSGNSFDRSLGKGYGEKNIISYAIDNSIKLSYIDYIIKLTGRYSIKYENIKDKLSPEYVLYSGETNLSENWAFTGFFKIPKCFWVNEISQDTISDAPGCYIENVIARKLQGKNISLIDDIGLSGISGTHNKIIS